MVGTGWGRRRRGRRHIGVDRRRSVANCRRRRGRQRGRRYIGGDWRRSFGCHLHSIKRIYATSNEEYSSKFESNNSNSNMNECSALLKFGRIRS